MSASRSPYFAPHGAPAIPYWYSLPRQLSCNIQQLRTALLWCLRRSSQLNRQMLLRRAKRWQLSRSGAGTWRPSCCSSQRQLLKLLVSKNTQPWRLDARQHRYLHFLEPAAASWSSERPHLVDRSRHATQSDRASCGLCTATRRSAL